MTPTQCSFSEFISIFNGAINLHLHLTKTKEEKCILYSNTAYSYLFILNTVNLIRDSDNKKNKLVKLPTCKQTSIKENRSCRRMAVTFNKTKIDYKPLLACCAHVRSCRHTHPSSSLQVLFVGYYAFTSIWRSAVSSLAVQAGGSDASPPVNRPGCPGSAASLLPPPRVDRPVQTDTFDFIAAAAGAAAHRVTHVPRLRLTVSSPQPAEPHPGIRVVTLILNGIYILCMEFLHFNYWLH